MAMPEDLVLVRHGHSEGNLAVDKSKQGDDSLYTQEFREIPGHRWRLTPEGVEQAKTAGKWIVENFPDGFFRYYVSSYVRTKETAANLGLPDAEWRIDPRLRERDWGDINAVPRSEFEELYSQNAKMKKIDSLYWRPPGGESIADVRLRIRNIFDTIHRECADRQVLIVTHGETMWATRAQLEYMQDEEWVEADKDPKQKLLNAHVIHYSRKDPSTGVIAKNMNWVRRICPYALGTDTGWLPINRRIFTNNELLEQVESVGPAITNN
jgi:broad specificity phosphatase PhoE